MNGAARIGRALFHYGFMPLYVGTAGLALLRASSETAAFVIGLVAYVPLMIAERLVPSHPEWNYRWDVGGAKSFAKDLFYLLGVAKFSRFLFAAALNFTWTYALRHVVQRVPIHIFPTSWPLGAQFALAALAPDFGTYWYHRAAHRFPILWRFHATHHFARQMNVLKGVVNHPVDFVATNTCGFIVIWLVGVPLELVFPALTFADLVSDLAHTNIRVSDQGFGWICSTPHYHAIHHSANVEESNSNYGCRFIIWDRLFGTLRPKFENEAAPVLGVEPLRERTLIEQLLRPLLPQKWPF